MSQGRYGEAEPLYREALQLSREVLGRAPPRHARSMNNLAALYESQGRYGEAEPLYTEALQLCREVLGPRHPNTLASMNNLAGLYQDQGRYGEAEPLFIEALQLRREVLGPRHPDTLQGMNNLAVLYDSQGRYGEAEPLYREALRLGREVLGARHPNTLQVQLNGVVNLAALQAGRGGGPAAGSHGAAPSDLARQRTLQQRVARRAHASGRLASQLPGHGHQPGAAPERRPGSSPDGGLGGVALQRPAGGGGSLSGADRAPRR